MSGAGAPRSLALMVPMITRASLDDDREDVVSADTMVDARSTAAKIADAADAREKESEGRLEGRHTGYAPTVTPDSIDTVESDPVPHDNMFALRYITSDLLGEGGMGEVRLARDARIGREVAMKVVRAGQGSRSDMRSRFLREARVQGQLEHPAIVPVYDLGARPDGAAFFTMKRVRGSTLEEILDNLRVNAPSVENEFSRRKLLAAFGSVCLAIDFAHARGVVHRDLKPGNIMLGGFGEVYVLDWGLAKINNDANPLSGKESEAVDAPASIRGQTEAGAVMGTPGYMAPEQLLTVDIDARADVYALGAILFEIIVGRPLHNKPKLAQVLESTLTGPETRASIVASKGDIPPELEAIWTKAVALKKEDRFASARELNDEIERFLDGDRDLEQRKKMAAGHLLRGEDLSKRARESQSTDDRKAAMQELGRALALDPSNGAAAGAMASLLAEPPRDLPPEAERELADADAQSLRVSGRAAFLAYGAWFLFAPFTLLAGYRDAWLSTLMGGFILVAALASLYYSKQERPSDGVRFVAVVFSTAGLAVSSRIFGPFMLVPALVLSNTVGFSLTRKKFSRRIATAIGLTAFIGPFALERMGVISPSYVFENGRISIMPHILSFEHPFWPCVLLVTAHIAIFIAATGYVGAVRDHLKRYERHALVQAWHFRQLAPDEARGAAAVAPPIAETCRVDRELSKVPPRSG